MKDKISIDDLYFGFKLPSISYIGEAERQKLKTYNLFGSSRVKSSVAMWVAGDDVFRKEHDFLRWCFSDVHARCQYEWLIAPWPHRNKEVNEIAQKVDVYEMYVEPNAKLLKGMVDRVSVSSAQRYLRDWRKGRR